MLVRVTSGYFFARLTSARLPIQPEFSFSIEVPFCFFLGIFSGSFFFSGKKRILLHCVRKRTATKRTSVGMYRHNMPASDAFYKVSICCAVTINNIVALALNSGSMLRRGADALCILEV